MPEPLCRGQGDTLLQVARDSIAHGLAAARPLPVLAADYAEALQVVRASFVTLNLAGKLRGCMGALEARLPLVEDVAEHAFAAAFRDPRFPPVGAGESSALDIHISILTPSEPMVIRDEADLLAQLRPGIDGLIIAQGDRRATFLPSVWASLSDPVQFLAHLKRKAGIPEGEKDLPLKAWRYSTESIPAENGA